MKVVRIISIFFMLGLVLGSCANTRKTIPAHTDASTGNYTKWENCPPGVICKSTP